MWPNRAVWAFAIAAVAGCGSSPAVLPYAAPVMLGDAGYSCDVTHVAKKVSEKKFELLVSMHQQGTGKCLDSLDALADAEAAKLCGPALHSVTGGDGKLTITADGGVERQGYSDANITYTIHCGNGA